jgi:hypothetical protein
LIGEIAETIGNEIGEAKQFDLCSGFGVGADVAKIIEFTSFRRPAFGNGVSGVAVF